jgi:DNA-binding CsgD family transcriptional regulator
VLREVGAAAGFELATMYGLTYAEGHVRVESGVSLGGELIAPFDLFLARSPVRFGAYDPMRPEPRQRNVVVSREALPELEASPVFRELFPELGLTHHAFMRVVLCDGRAFLGYVGGWRAEPFHAQHREDLSALVPALRRHLRLNSWVGRARFSSEALKATLDAIGAPAFVLRAGGGTSEANAIGRLLLDTEPLATRSRLARAESGLERGAQVTPIRVPGIPPHRLVVLPADEHGLRARAALVARRWGLTERQVEVLIHVVRGAPNKAIASALGCSVRNVEVHVSSLLERAACGSRAELGARFWRAI